MRPRIYCAPVTAMLDLIPLHLQVKKEATMGGIRLEQDTTFKSEDLVDHL